jgi:hypothetical protein
MSDRQRRERGTRLVEQAYRSEGLAPFFMHDDVQQFFKLYEAGCVNEIAVADANDDDVRRNAGMKLQAMRQLKQHIAEIIATGERAKVTLEKIDD